MLSEAPDRTLRMSQLAGLTTSSAEPALARGVPPGGERLGTPGAAPDRPARGPRGADRRRLGRRAGRGARATWRRSARPSSTGWTPTRSRQLRAISERAGRPALSPPRIACASWRSSSSPPGTPAAGERGRPAAREAQGAGHAAPRPGRAEHHRPAAARHPRPDRLGARATRGGCCGSSPSSSRASARSPSSAARSACSARPGCTPTTPSTPSAGRSAGCWPRPATPSSPAAAPARWRPPTAAPARPAGSRSGSASSCPSSRA